MGQDLDYTPPLDYLPNFDIQEIERALEERWSDVVFALLGAALTFVLVTILSAKVDPRMWLLFAAIILWIGRILFAKLSHIITLHWRLRQARDSAAARPIDDHDYPQPVNWWRLLNSGFTPVEYDEPHEDPKLRLAGRPWRVLHDGSLRIPIFHKWSGKAELGPQQLARIAAYCHLIETAEGGKSPYGVVLFGDNVEGMTVPNNQQNQQQFYQGLKTARDVVQITSSSPLHAPTPPASHCRQCPLGNPRLYQTSGLDAGLGNNQHAAFRTRAKDGQLYHSSCGDFFRWVPPHARAAELEIC